MSGFEKFFMFGSMVLLVLMLAFASGFAYRHFNLWPVQDLTTFARQLKTYIKYGEWARLNTLVFADVQKDTARVQIKRPEDFLAGYRFVMGYDAELDGYSVRLLDAQARQIHVWPIDYATLVSDQSVDGINPHGMDVLPDGSVIVNFGVEGTALVRLDVCGTQVWVLDDGRYHHSVHIGDDGQLWTWFSPNQRDTQLESIVSVDVETGEVRRKISMQEVAAASAGNAATLTLPEGFELRATRNLPPNVTSDIFHPNDVEPLSSAMAPAFPMFETGDLLISLRNIDYVGVLDPQTLELKWGQHGPWVRQHDPDFTADGHIEIYNNNDARGRSNILSVDPNSGALKRAFISDESNFYSRVQGKQQKLPNGNYLITIPDEGRVIEVNRGGEMVFEFNNIVANGVNGRTLNAYWVPEDFFEKTPRCDG